MSSPSYDFGLKLKEARQLRSLSQRDVGKVLGVSFQQVQKYENGVNRISLESILSLKEKLGINLLDASLFVNPQAYESDVQPPIERLEYDLLSSFRGIKNPDLQRKVLLLVQAMTREE